MELEAGSTIAFVHAIVELIAELLAGAATVASTCNKQIGGIRVSASETEKITERKRERKTSMSFNCNVSSSRSVRLSIRFLQLQNTMELLEGDHLIYCFAEVIVVEKIT